MESLEIQKCYRNCMFFFSSVLHRRPVTIFSRIGPNFSILETYKVYQFSHSCLIILGPKLFDSIQPHHVPHKLLNFNIFAIGPQRIDSFRTPKYYINFQLNPSSFGDCKFLLYGAFVRRQRLQRFSKSFCNTF